MFKLINSLRYGNKKTKAYLWTMVLLAAGAAIFAVLAFLFGIPALWVLCGLCVVIDIVMWRSAEFYVTKFNPDEKDKMLHNAISDDRKQEQYYQNVSESVPLKETDEAHDIYDIYNSDKKKRSYEGGLDRVGDSEDDDMPGRRKYMARKEQETLEEASSGFYGKTNEEREKEVKERRKPFDEEDEEDFIPTYEVLASYTKKKLRKTFFKYKVKKQRVPIIIDHYNDRKVSHTPAFLWAEKGCLFIITIEEKPRMFKIPANLADGMRIEDLPFDDRIDTYTNITGKKLGNSYATATLICSIFSPLIPKVHESNEKNKAHFRKNLYSIGEDIWCTGPSVKNIKKVISQNMILKDSKYNSSVYNDYYRAILMLELLRKDEALTSEELKTGVMQELTKMSKAGIDRDTFNNYLAQMLRDGLIPKEYGEYALNARRNRMVHSK